MEWGGKDGDTNQTRLAKQLKLSDGSWGFIIQVSTFVCVLNFYNKTFRIQHTVIIPFLLHTYVQRRKNKKIHTKTYVLPIGDRQQMIFILFYAYMF